MLTATVLIVNYNSGNRLANVCKALERQTFRDFQVLVLDNASQDDSALGAPQQDARFTTILNPTNSGFAGGVMDALPHINTPLLAILNPDAYPEPGWLAALVTAAETYGPATALGSVQIDAASPENLDGLGDVYHASGVAWRGGFGKPRAKYPISADREIFAPCFAAAMVHREHFVATGGLDRDFFCYHEDVDYGFRLRLFGGRSVLVADAVVSHEGSAITGRYSQFTVHHGIRNRLWTLVKNVPWALLLIVIPLYVVFSLGFLLRSCMLGIGRPYVTGFVAGLKGLGPVLRDRRDVQSRRTATTASIAKAMSWSPLAPFRRAPDLRPVSPPPSAELPR